MDILILEDSSISNFGGGQKITLEVSEILSRKYNLHFADFTNNSIYESRLYQKRGTKSDIILKRVVPPKKLIAIILYPWVFIFNLIKLFKYIISKDIDIIYSTTRLTIIYSFFINLILRKPFIHHGHMVNSLRGFSNYIWKVISNRAYKIICVSKAVEKKQNSSNTELIYNPCKNSYGFKGVKNSLPKVIAVIGSLNNIKGFEYFVEAADFLPELEFRIYGTGPLEKKLKAKAGSNIRFMGFCDNIFSELYKCIDVIVVPTIIEEALNLTIIEAKSVGIPVIATNIGGQAEIIQDNRNGILVPIEDSRAISEAIKKLTSNLELYNSMSKESYNSFKKFDYNLFSNKISNLFNEAEKRFCK